MHEHHRLRRHRPGHGRDDQDLRDDQRRRPDGCHRPRGRRAPALGPRDDGRRARRGHRARRRDLQRAPAGARRDHRPRDGQADRAGHRRGRVRRRDLPVLRRQRRRPAEGRADRPARRRGLGVRPALLGGAAAGDHAVELPLLPGGPLRRPEPGRGQHDPAQARPAVPGVLGRDGADLPRGRGPAGRLHQHLRDQRPDRRRHRGPARAGRVADRQRPGGRGGGRARGPQPQEGRARARRVGPVHRAEDRRPRRGRRGRGRRAPGEHGAGLQRGQALHRARRASTTRSWRSSPRS